MKKISFLVIITLFCTSLFAQLENTRWKTMLHADRLLNAIIDFKKDTVTLYTVADSAIIETMTYTMNDTSFTLTKINGESDCDDGSAGKYGFIIKGDSLFFRLLQDECSDRYVPFKNARWSKWKNYPGIKVDEPTLKAYTGVYAHDDAHPITISLENGVLYATGPNNGLPKSPFTPITISKFFLRIAGVEMDFIKDANGNIVTLISHEENDFELKKIK